jgi:hypothetical protein
LFLANEKNIDNLKKQVKKEKSIMKDVKASALVVWRCTDRSVPFDTKDRKTFEHRIQEAFSNQKVQILNSREKFADLDVSEDETLFVQMPGVFLAPTFHASIIK